MHTILYVIHNVDDNAWYAVERSGASSTRARIKCEMCEYLSMYRVRTMLPGDGLGGEHTYCGRCLRELREKARETNEQWFMPTI